MPTATEIGQAAIAAAKAQGIDLECSEVRQDSPGGAYNLVQCGRPGQFLGLSAELIARTPGTLNTDLGYLDADRAQGYAPSNYWSSISQPIQGIPLSSPVASPTGSAGPAVPVPGFVPPTPGPAPRPVVTDNGDGTFTYEGYTSFTPERAIQLAQTYGSAEFVPFSPVVAPTTTKPTRLEFLRWLISTPQFRTAFANAVIAALRARGYTIT